MDNILISLSSDDKFNVIYLIILLVFVGSSIIVHFRGKPIKFLKDASIWLAVIAVLIIGYSYRYDLKNMKNRLVGELYPSSAISNQDGSISFRVSRDGHYHVTAKVNRTPIQFLLDTGASDIVLSKQDAKKIGINTNRLKYTKTYNTANGKVKAAPIKINTLKIGQITMYDINASVNSAPMDKSLLGMSFLEQLDGYEVREGILTLWQ